MPANHHDCSRKGLTVAIVCCAVLVIVLVGFLQAARAQTDVEQGRAIFVAREKLDTGYVDQQVSMDMTLRSNSGREASRRIKIMQLEGEPGQGDKVLIVFEAPADIKGTALLTHEALGVSDDQQWLYLPAYKRVKRIAATNRSGRFVGTEFSYEDLSGDKLEDFDYRYLGEEEHDGQRLHKVERIPLSANSEYSRQVTWVNSDNHQVVRAFLYDKQGTHLKTLEATDWTQYQERFWRAHTMVMTHIPSGRSTLLKTSKYEFGVGSSDKDYSPSALKRIR